MRRRAAICPAPPHPLEHFVLGMLQRHIEIGNDFIALTESLDQLRCNGIRIGIQDTEPVDLVDFFETVEQFYKGRRTRKVPAIAGGILRDQR